MWFLGPIPIFLSVAVVLVGVLRTGRRLFPGMIAARRGFRCPFRDENVTVDFEEAVWDGRLVDVAACTAFAPAQDVRCDKACRTLDKLPPARTEAALGTR